MLAFAYRAGARLAFAAVEHEAHATRVEIVRSALDPRGRRSGMRDGELLSVTASDAELSALVVRVAGLTAAALTAIVVAAVALLVVDIPLGLGVLIGVPLLVVALQRMAPLLTRRSTSQQEALAATTALAVDLVSGLRVLRGIGAQDHAARRYAGASRHALDVTLRAATTKGLHLGLTTTVNGLFLATVAGVAGWLALQGRLTIGELVAVVGLAQFIAEPVQTLGYCVQLFAMARASAGRVARVLGAAPAVQPGDAGPPAPSPSRLTLDGVSYAGLDDVSLRVRAGEILGVLAYDPSEAEALVALLAGRVPRADHRGTSASTACPPTSCTSTPRAPWSWSSSMTWRCSRGRCAPISAPAPPSTTRSCAPPCGLPQPRTCSPRTRTDSTACSPNAGRTCPAGSGSGSGWPGRSSPTRRCWCCTTPPRRSTR